MKKILTFFLLLFALTSEAQFAQPVRFTSDLKMLSDGEAEIVFTGKIDAGWHVYSTNLKDGPIAATFNSVKMDGAEPVGKLQARGKEQSKFDQMFGMNVRYFENQVTFAQKIKFTKPDYNIDCYLEYGACNDETCLPPSEVAMKKSGKAPVVKEPEKKEETTNEEASADETKAETEAEEAVKDSLATDSAALMALTDADKTGWWTPVTGELSKYQKPVSSSSLLYIFLAGLLNRHDLGDLPRMDAAAQGLDFLVHDRRGVVVHIRGKIGRIKALGEGLRAL